MAMDENRAKDNIIDNMGGLKGNVGQNTDAEAFILAIAKGILDEIKANGVIDVPADSNGDTTDPGTIS